MPEPLTDEELARFKEITKYSSMRRLPIFHADDLDRFFATIDARDAQITQLEEITDFANGTTEMAQTRADKAEIERDHYRAVLERALTECDAVNESGEEWYIAARAVLQSNPDLHSPAPNASQSPKDLDSARDRFEIALQKITHCTACGVCAATALGALTGSGELAEDFSGE